MWTDVTEATITFMIFIYLAQTKTIAEIAMNLVKSVHQIIMPLVSTKVATFVEDVFHFQQYLLELIMASFGILRHAILFL